jgi:uncharacterized Tic20 family protein
MGESERLAFVGFTALFLGLLLVFSTLVAAIWVWLLRQNRRERSQR